MNNLKHSQIGFDVAVVGATGEVGREMIKILEQRNFPLRSLRLLASSRQQDRVIEHAGKQIPVEPLAEFDFSQAQLALFAAGGSVAEEYAPQAAAAGCLSVDNSSAFRYASDVPLVIPEVNPQMLDDKPPQGIVANPNCSTIQLLTALHPLYRQAGIERIYVATYQSVSGAGKKGIEELEQQATSMLQGEKLPSECFPDTIGFNVIPHIDEFQSNGFTREEMKIVWETHKILDDPDINVSATAVRVPVFYGHSEAVFLSTRKYIGTSEARNLLSEAEGVVVIDEAKAGGYPTPVTQASGEDAVFVGRIREDIWERRGLHLWIVSDNIRKGAALNAVQILEILAARHLV